MRSNHQTPHDLLQLDKFRHWLEKHREDDIVGFMADPEHCPVASFLRDHGHESVIGADHIICGYSHIPTPAWVNRFVDHIDDTLDHDAEEITAHRALVCINIVGSEMLTKACAANIEAYARVDQPIEDC